jgi:DNA-binding GntR family transcriptional regulator
MLIDEAYREIKEMIFGQALAPGQKLNYGGLSRRMHMSPTPIINALHRLEHEGFVESAPFRGFHVKKIGLQEAWDLFGVREALETWTVEQAILVGEPAELEALEEKFAQHAAYRPDVYDRRRFQLDSAFHLQLAAMGRNQALIRQLATTLEHFFIRFRFESISLDRLRSSVAEHRQIIDRLKRKDIHGCREAMRMHIQNARNHIMRSLSDEPAPEASTRAAAGNDGSANGRAARRAKRKGITTDWVERARKCGPST